MLGFSEDEESKNLLLSVRIMLLSGDKVMFLHSTLAKKLISTSINLQVRISLFFLYKNTKKNMYNPLCLNSVLLLHETGGGFESKDSYGSGLFEMRIKVPGGNTGGIVTAFYVCILDYIHIYVD